MLLFVQMLCYFQLANSRFLSHEMSQLGSTYLIGDPASKVFDGELWEGHLWLQIQWVVAMVIVTLLEKSVVRCLATNQQTLNDMCNN